MIRSVELETEVFRLFPYGIIAVGPDRTVLECNSRAAELLGPIEEGAQCCDLVGCRSGEGPLSDDCVSDLARAHGEPVPEVRLDIGEDGAVAVWVTAAPLEDGRVVIELRPGAVGDRRRRTMPHWVAGPQLCVYALGHTRVESREGSIGGRWLEHRPGHLLKLLVAERRRVVHIDEIADALWPEADLNAASNVRYLVHALREQIDPDRPKRGEARFVLSVQGGYQLDADRVWVDADSFEKDVAAGLTAHSLGDSVAAEKALERGLSLYRGEFLADEPHALWALHERDRLRVLACDALEGLVTVRMRRDDVVGASKLMDRLADLQPFDIAIQRRRIAFCLVLGHHSDAVRHYDALRKRMRRVFRVEPAFELADVTGRETRSG